MAPLQVKLSLSSWEKELIGKTKETFSEDLGVLSPQESSVSHDWIRNNWSWATHVLVQLRQSCHEMDDEEMAIHHRDPDRTWQILRNGLSSRTPPGTSWKDYSCRSRTRLLLDANSDLQSLVSQKQLPSIPQDCIQLTKDDDQDWQSVWNFSEFIKTNHPRLHGAHCSIDDLKELDQLGSRISTPQNVGEGGHENESERHSGSKVIEKNILCEYPHFEVYSIVRTVASYCRQSQVDLPKELAHLDKEWSSFLNDLEYIPISELRKEGELAHHPVVSWLPSKACPLDHHLFTEEEVFKYCVEAEFEFPGFRGQNGVIFVATELDNTQLCQRRENIPLLWNDCAFTFDPATGSSYLLQTRPGITFRELQKRFSLDAARKYFRSTIDKVRLNKHQTLDNVLHEMQVENPKIKAYGGLVELIPFHEINLSGEVDDTGHSGAIHFATWHVPQGARLQKPDSEAIPIALKRVWRPDSQNQDLSKREFESSIITFTDAPIASIRLDGLTINPETNDIFLVFEKATNVPEFLDTALLSNGKDWDLISELFRDAADSLEMIHQRGHLHRDIHLGNVMIHSVPCPNDPFESEYTELVIIDLGQGQQVTNNVWVSPNYYGNSDYRAPEVILKRQYSEKSDVFAIGCLMTEILWIRCQKADDYEVPQVLWNLVASCLQNDPDGRPDAQKLAAEAQQLRDKIFVVPEKRTLAVRGEVVMNGPSVNLKLVSAERSRKYDGNYESDYSVVVPRYEDLED